MERDRLKNGTKIVETVRTPAYNLQMQIDLRKRWESKVGGHCFRIRAKLLNVNEKPVTRHTKSGPFEPASDFDHFDERYFRNRKTSVM